MTNGEKIKTMFPSMKVGFITDSQIGIYFVKNQHSAIVFSLDWWNAEYEEPTTKNNLAVDCISRIETIDYLCRHCPDDGECFKDCDEIKHLRQMPSITPQEPSDNDVVLTYDMYHDLIADRAGKLEQELVLDKIRAEIVELQKDYHEYGWAYDDALNIIDKYKAESEVK